MKTESMPDIAELEAEVASLRLLCDNQRRLLEALMEAAGIFNDIVTAILSASTMTGTSEK